MDGENIARRASGVRPEAAKPRDDDQALRKAIEELFATCQLRVGRYLAQMVDDRALAEDLLQDSFHDALRSRAQLPQVRNREAWLYGVPPLPWTSRGTPALVESRFLTQAAWVWVLMLFNSNSIGVSMPRLEWRRRRSNA